MTLGSKRRAWFVRSWCVVFAVTTACAGCASVVEGRRQEVAFSSDPPGASVIVDGTNLGTTPAKIELARRQSHSVRIEKAGYVAYETTTSSALNKWQWEGVVPGLLFPPAMLMPYFDDGAYEIEPHEVSAHLIPAPAVPNR